MNYTYLYIALGAVAFSIFFYLFTVVFASYQIYLRTLIRRSKQDWSRHSPIEHPLQRQMHQIGNEWQKPFDSIKNRVHIVNNGMNLYGEYYDFGAKRTVLMLWGRTDTLEYGYYFAQLYHKAGYNVLTVDPRAHGDSDGVYNTVGFEESKDARAWCEFLHKEYGTDEILIHGTCIGAAAGVYVITADDCPDYVAGLVAEGLFPTFRESMKNNLIQRKKLMPPVLDCINFWFKKKTGHSYNIGPQDFLHKMKKPMLFLQSKQDKSSLAQNTQRLYDICASDKKEIVFFDKGEHSLIRICNTKEYDDAVYAFINKNFNIQKEGN